MSITQDRNRISTPFTRKETEHAHTSVNRLRDRLRTLALISTSSTASARGSRATREALSLLQVVGCVIHSTSDKGEQELFFQHLRDDVEPNNLKGLADILKSSVVSAGHAVIIQDLRQQFPSHGWLLEQNIDGYLGVPIFDSERSISAVVAVFGERTRIFGEEDEWWLRTAGQLVVDLFDSEMLQAKQRSLEHLLVPSRPVGQADLSTRKPTVLVIDDDRAVNDLICELLTMEGYEVESAFDGVDAIQAFRPAKHDLVITDVAMPRMNGWELIAALRVRSPTLPIILISGYQTGEWNQSYLTKQGVSAVLNKPLDLNYLTTLVSKLVRPKAIFAIS